MPVSCVKDCCTLCYWVQIGAQGPFHFSTLGSCSHWCGLAVQDKPYDITGILDVVPGLSQAFSRLWNCITFSLHLVAMLNIFIGKWYKKLPYKIVFCICGGKLLKSLFPTSLVNLTSNFKKKVLAANQYLNIFHLLSIGFILSPMRKTT